MCVCLIMLRLFSRLAATVRKSVKKVAESAHDMSKQGPLLRAGSAREFILSCGSAIFPFCAIKRSVF